MDNTSSQASIASQSTYNYDKSCLSRRSVDWRDSGIVIDDWRDSGIEIDDDQYFNSFDSAHIFETKPQPLIATIGQSSTDPSSTCPSRQIVSDQDGDTVLHLAVVGSSERIVRDLIKICDLNAMNNMMQTPLHLAVMANRPEMVELLVKSGAKLDAHDRRGNTPIHIACERGHRDIADSILHYTHSSSMSPQQCIEMPNFDGQNCLHLAAVSGKMNIIDLLANKYEANVNCRDSKSGETILHKATKRSDVDMVDFILKLQKHCNEPDYSLRTPLNLIQIMRQAKITDRSQLEKIIRIENLIASRIEICIENGGCCEHNQLDPDANFSSDSSGSDSSDSDSDNP